MEAITTTSPPLNSPFAELPNPLLVRVDHRTNWISAVRGTLNVMNFFSTLKKLPVRNFLPQHPTVSEKFFLCSPAPTDTESAEFLDRSLALRKNEKWGFGLG